MKFDEKSSNQMKSSGVKKRRSKQSHRAILESTLAILAEKGYSGLSIESIAAKAKVSKQTIYRWWSSKAAIVLEALTADTQERLPCPDTGRMRDDIEQLLGSSLRDLTQRSRPIVRFTLRQRL